MGGFSCVHVLGCISLGRFSEVDLVGWICLGGLCWVYGVGLMHLVYFSLWIVLVDLSRWVLFWEIVFYGLFWVRYCGWFLSGWAFCV